MGSRISSTVPQVSADLNQSRFDLTCLFPVILVSIASVPIRLALTSPIAMLAVSAVIIVERTIRSATLLVLISIRRWLLTLILKSIPWRRGGSYLP